MSDLRDLYQELILDHGRRPRNHRRLEPADRTANGHNPLCGDRLTLFLRMEGDVIRDAAFEGSGCAISTASASILTETVKGRSVADAERLYHRFHDLVTGRGSGDAADLGKLAVFEGVKEYPARVKCASLAWHTLHAALTGPGGSVTTE